MSKIRVDNIVDRNDSAGPNFTYGATIPEGQYFNHQGNIKIALKYEENSKMANVLNIIKRNIPKIGFYLYNIY